MVSFLNIPPSPINLSLFSKVTIRGYNLGSGYDVTSVSLAGIQARVMEQAQDFVSVGGGVSDKKGFTSVRKLSKISKIFQEIQSFFKPKWSPTFLMEFKTASRFVWPLGINQNVIVKWTKGWRRIWTQH